jgi:outer membrane lipoprotein SlyB
MFSTLRCLRRMCLRRKMTAANLLGAWSLVAPASAQQYYYQPPPSYYQNDTATGAVVGGGLGAVTGALIGGRDHRGGGALIGAGVGALTGGLVGNAVDQADRRAAATGTAVVAQANAQVAAMAVTNFDLVEMTRAGVGDDVIISTIRSRGGRFDLSPGGLIALKQSGVSDRVVMAAQSAGPSASAYVAPAAPAIIAPPPAVYVQPAPVIYFHSGWGWGHHHHHHGWRHGHHHHHHHFHH